jgi:hypothetical protein
MNINNKKVWNLFLVLIFISGFILSGSIFSEIPGSAASAQMGAEVPMDNQDHSGQMTITNSDEESTTEFFIPIILNKFGIKISIDMWSADKDGRQKSAFVPNEPMTFYIQVENPMGRKIVANILVDKTGLCSDTVLNYWTEIDPGETIYEFNSTAPAANCKGIYSLNSTVTYEGKEVKQTIPYMVYVSLEQAFDKCNIGTVGQMQTWWNLSPYKATNLYIGGVKRACGNLGLTREWVSAVSQQGWRFIPTWVGPQAPCSKYTPPRISYIESIAYQQGRDNADEAITVASSLGFGPGSSIFIDIENYGLDPSYLCRKAVSYFVNGWVERLHEDNYRAGGYGGYRQSYVRDWFEMQELWGLFNVPDEVWIAAWSWTPVYNPNANVWLSPYGEEYLPNTYWSQNQRIKQYAGDHNETYGGITFNIDSNVLNVPLSNVGGYHSLVDEVVTMESVIPSASNLGEFQLLSHDQGWVITNGQLYWTADGGFSWTPVDHPHAGETPVTGVYFLDELHGWIFLFSARTGQPLVLSTTSGPDGEWEVVVLENLHEDSWNLHSAHFDFINGNIGWLSMKLATGSNFSLGELFKTEDGGLSWSRLKIPIGGQVTFLDEQRGWTAGGPGNSSLYETHDGGHTWRPLEFDYLFPIEVEAISLPVFRNKQEGVLTLTGSTSTDLDLKILETKDGGITWNLKESIGLPEEVSTDLPAVMVDKGEEYFVSPLSPGSPLYRLSDNTSEIALMVSANLPSGTNNIQYIEETGWAQTSQGSCHGQKTVPGEIVEEDAYWACSYEMRLWRTVDGGRTWQDITPFP